MLFVVSQNKETTKNFLFGSYDASAAAENMLLAAHSVGLGGCYIGSAWESFADPFGQEVLKKWNIRTDYYAALHVLLGYPKDEQAPKGKARKEGRLRAVSMQRTLP